MNRNTRSLATGSCSRPDHAGRSSGDCPGTQPTSRPSASARSARSPSPRRPACSTPASPKTGVGAATTAATFRVPELTCTDTDEGFVTTVYAISEEGEFLAGPDLFSYCEDGEFVLSGHVTTSGGQIPIWQTMEPGDKVRLSITEHAEGTSTHDVAFSSLTRGWTSTAADELADRPHRDRAPADVDRRRQHPAAGLRPDQVHRCGVRRRSAVRGRCDPDQAGRRRGRRADQRPPRRPRQLPSGVQDRLSQLVSGG